MARKPLDQQIAQIEARAKALKSRLAKQQRAQDTRRKILLGAFVFSRLEQNDDNEFTKRFMDWLQRELPMFLTREEDRELFAGFLTTNADLAAPIMTEDDQI